jgi:hypothetical protein
MKNLIVIDNFYANAPAVRDYALNKVNYLEPDASGERAGVESRQCFYSQGSIQKMESSLGVKILPDPKSFSFGAFVKTFEHDMTRQAVHIDGSDWTGIVFLSEAPASGYGTSFYRHRSTGLELLPRDSELQTLGFTNTEDFNERFLKPESQNLKNWAVTAKVDCKFNRLVLFRSGRMFHSAQAYFGKNDQDCRLTQVFFFKTGEAI